MRRAAVRRAARAYLGAALRERVARADLSARFVEGRVLIAKLNRGHAERVAPIRLALVARCTTRTDRGRLDLDLLLVDYIALRVERNQVGLAVSFAGDDHRRAALEHRHVGDRGIADDERLGARGELHDLGLVERDLQHAGRRRRLGGGCPNSTRARRQRRGKAKREATWFVLFEPRAAANAAPARTPSETDAPIWPEIGERTLNAQGENRPIRQTIVNSSAKPAGRLRRQGRRRGCAISLPRGAARFLLDRGRFVEPFRNGSTAPLWVMDASNASAVELGIP